MQVAFLVWFLRILIVKFSFNLQNLYRTFCKETTTEVTVTETTETAAADEEQEKVDIDLEDPQTEEAAIKIQVKNTFKGYSRMTTAKSVWYKLSEPLGCRMLVRSQWLREHTVVYK